MITIITCKIHYTEEKIKGFFDRSVSFLLASKCFVLFEVTYLLMFFSFPSKSVFFIKSATSSLVANFAFQFFSLTISLVNIHVVFIRKYFFCLSLNFLNIMLEKISMTQFTGNEKFDISRFIYSQPRFDCFLQSLSISLIKCLQFQIFIQILINYT